LAVVLVLVLVLVLDRTAENENENENEHERGHDDAESCPAPWILEREGRSPQRAV